VNIRNRVKELRLVAANDLRPNPKNWRTHPPAQQDALRGVLAEIGMADAVLARELEDGSLMLIDGHLRAETAVTATVPVLVLDVNEAEADKLLATLDPLAAMANSDAVKLDELLRNVDTGSAALQQMIADTAAQAGLYTDQWEGKGVEDTSEIGEYDPDDETVSIRLNNVPAAQRDAVAAAVDAAVQPFGFKCEVF
jgi:ParB-like chromosome segregation protein Spo0J